MTDERRLHVFSDGEECYIAYDAEDAWALWTKSTGEKRADYEFEDGSYWTCLADDHVLKICMDAAQYNGTAPAVAKTCAEWVATNERGYLCGHDE